MKTLLILSFCLSSFSIAAQNVGIGTSSPSYKLQVHNPDGANNYMNITNTTSGSTATDGLFMGLTGNSAILGNLENGNLSLGTNNLTRILITAGGDVGIGTATPTAKLDINGNVKLEGLNLFEFGAGIAGKELNAGKIGYNAFGTTALAIVGAGTSASNRAIYLFAEGGTTFTGPATIAGNVNMGGQLQLNGSAGAAGQVLTSNGLADPTWMDAAFGNNTRFALSFSATTSTGGFSYPLTTDYNLNPADITVGATSITINKTGLYHFDFYAHYLSSSTTQPLYYLWLYGLFSSTSITWLLRDEIVSAFAISGSNFRGNWRMAMDVHITAPKTIELRANSINLSTTSVTDGYILGYLVNE